MHAIFYANGTRFKRGMRTFFPQHSHLPYGMPDTGTAPFRRVDSKVEALKDISGVETIGCIGEYHRKGSMNLHTGFTTDIYHSIFPFKS